MIPTRESIPMHGPGGLLDTFLGIADDAPTPNSVLGVPPDANATRIMEGLYGALARVASHPRGESPEAGGVRALLHASAMRLMTADPRESHEQQVAAEIRQVVALGGGWNGQTRMQAARLATMRGVAPDRLALLMAMAASATSAHEPGLTTQTLRGGGGIGHGGAWGTAARISQHAPPRPTDGARTRPKPQNAPHAAADVPSTDGEAAAPDRAADVAEIDPMVRLVRAVLLGTVFVVLGLLGAGAAVWVLWNLPKPTQSASDSTATPATPAGTIVGPVGPPAGPKPATPTDVVVSPNGPKTTPRLGDWVDLVREVEAASAAWEGSGATADARFSNAASAMAIEWPTATPDQRVAAIDAIITFLYRSSGTPGEGGSAPAAVAALAAGTDAISGAPLAAGDQIAPAAWSGGVLARLSRESNLPIAARDAVRRAFDRAFPGSASPADTTFQAGAWAVLSGMPDRMIAGAKPALAGGGVAGLVAGASAKWEVWVTAVKAVHGPAAPETERAVLLALDAVLTVGQQPTLSRETFDAVGTLARSLHWRAGEASREWLLRWFDSPTITTADLFALTSAIASSSVAPGVDPSMVLPATATAEARQDLRTRYASAWGLEGGTSKDSLVQEWAGVATKALDQQQSGGGEGDAPADAVASLRRAVALARLGTVAARLWAGETEGIVDALNDYDQGLPTPAPSTADRARGFLDDSKLGDPSWLVQYRAAGQNPATRKDLLVHYSRDPSLLDASVIVEEAVRGSPSQVRIAARDIVTRHAARPSIAWAMLNLAATIPVTADNSELVGAVTGTIMPPTRSPAWRVAATRALVQRMLEVMAGTGELRAVEDYADALAESYALRAQAGIVTSAPTLPPTGGAPAPPPPAGTTARRPAKPSGPIESSAIAWRGRLQREAESIVPSGHEPISVAASARRREARESVAVGRVQDFGAQQAACAELLAFLVVAERPDQAAAASKVLDDLRDDRRRALHVFQQLAAGERAMLRLWLLRSGHAPPPAVGDAGPRLWPVWPAALAGAVIASGPDDAQGGERGVLAGVTERLQALRPDRPEDYLALGEEVADAAANANDRRLAVELLVLAFELDRARWGAAGQAAGRAGVAASACAALAELSPAGRDRRWLEAVAVGVNPSQARPRWLVRRAPGTPESNAYQVAAVVGLIRAGEGNIARSMLDRKDIGRSFDSYDRLMRQLGISGGAAGLRDAAYRSPCRECQNTGAVRRGGGAGGVGVGGAQGQAEHRLCPVCKGLAGPRLDDGQIVAQLRFEAWLLEGAQKSWAAQVAVDDGSPLQDADPDGVAGAFGVDPTRRVWRGGHWAAP